MMATITCVHLADLHHLSSNPQSKTRPVTYIILMLLQYLVAILYWQQVSKKSCLHCTCLTRSAYPLIWSRTHYQNVLIKISPKKVVHRLLNLQNQKGMLLYKEKLMAHVQWQVLATHKTRVRSSEYWHFFMKVNMDLGRICRP